jgi:hypothetical protein
MGCKEKYTPFGIVDEDRGELALCFGRSAHLVAHNSAELR